MNPLRHQKFAVWGAGRSGVAAANLLVELGKSVVLSDSAAMETIAGGLEGLDPRVEVVAGGNVVGKAQIVVLSPGLKPSLPVITALEVPVLSEIELARRVSNHRWLAITGTDGKTTTTELTAHLVRTAGRKAVAAGNIGTPLSEVVLGLEHDTVIVAEVSAFQLWSTNHLPASAVTVTNVEGDHLDYFDGDMEAYRAAKKRLLELAGPQAVAVLHGGRDPMSAWAQAYEGTVRRFFVGEGPDAEGAEGADPLRFVGEKIDVAGYASIDWSKVALKGEHNALNAMTACGLALAVGADPSTFQAGLESFAPLPHRVEPVGQVGGVHFVNDSKATNVHAAITGLESVEGELVVIAGGVDKGLELEGFSSYLVGRKADVVVIGDIRERLSTALREAGQPEEKMCVAETFAEAIGEAHKRATPDKTVVLSPACSSFDMFASYADRGEQFRSLVGELEG